MPLSGTSPVPASPPPSTPARLGLPPLYRPFVDALEGTGDWELVEPYGWVFRPDVNPLVWRPYRDGWWTPSDLFGWVWNSEEPFGWITYHYGSWFHDRYQGWVWQPGPVWGPAWVAWVAVDDLIGWAPLAPEGYADWPTIPGGAYLFARAQVLDATHGGLRAASLGELPPVRGDVREIGEEFDLGSGRVVMGPSLETARRLGSGAAAREVAAPRRVSVGPGLRAAPLEPRVRSAIAEARRAVAARRAGVAPPPGPSGPAPSFRKPGATALGRPALTPRDSAAADSVMRKAGGRRAAERDTTRR